MSGYPKLGNISAEAGDPLCFNCRGEGWVTVRVPLKRRSKVELGGARTYPNRIECPKCQGSGVRPRMMDGQQRRMFP